MPKITFGFCTIILILGFSCRPTLADSWGFAANGQITTNLPTTTFGGGGSFTYAFQTPNDISQNFYFVNPVNRSDSVTAYDPKANGIYTAFASASIQQLGVNDGQLQFWIENSGGIADPYIALSAYTNAYARWTDTLSVGGPAPGAPVLLSVTFNLDGVLNFTGGPFLGPSDPEPNSYFLSQPLFYANGSQQNNCGVPGALTSIEGSQYGQQFSPATQRINTQQTYLFCAQSGETLTLEEQLVGTIGAGGSGAQWSGSINAQDTASTNITVLTSGATITSASGVNYASSASPVPEPSTRIILFVGCLLVAIAKRLFSTQPARVGMGRQSSLAVSSHS